MFLVEGGWGLLGYLKTLSNFLALLYVQEVLVKQCSYSKLQYKMGQDFLDIQYTLQIRR